MKNYPVVLQGNIQSISVNQIRAPEERALQNRTDRTVCVRELRFRGTRASDLTSATGIFMNDIEVQMRIGNEPVTSGFVNLASMVWQADNSNGTERGAQRPWHVRYSKPVLLAPGEQINLQARNINPNGLAAFLEVIALCEDADELRPSYVPWHANFITPTQVDGSGIFEDVSTESDLVNPFDQEMIVERLIGRVIYGGMTASSGNGERSLPFDRVRLRIEDQDATQIIRDPTPLGNVIDWNFHTWKIDASLRSKGFYRVAVESRLKPQAVISAPRDVFTTIGMLGFRSVK